MHPVSDQRNYGVHGLKVRYHNGQSVVDGYIVKQRSHTRFKISSLNKVLQAVKVVSAGTGLTNGTRTFTVAGGTSTATATFTATVSGGSVVGSSIVITNVGTYSVNPVNVATNAATVDSGSTNATFALTFGVPTHTCKLAPTTVLAGTPTLTTYSPFSPGWFTILVNPVDGGTGTTFTAHYGANAATIGTAGTRYRVGDVLSGPSNIKFNVATLSATGDVIATVTVNNAGTGLTNGTRTFTVVGGTGTATTFTATVTAGSVVGSSIAITNTGFYSVDPSLTANACTVDTGSTNATFNLTTAVAGAVASVTVNTAGDVTVKPSNPVTLTGGSLGNSGTAAVNITYKGISVAVSGGTKYQVGQTLTFTGLTGTAPTAHISAINKTTGAPTAVVLDTPGSNISVFATSVTKNAGTVPTEHVKKIYANNILTTEGNTYTWDIDNSSTVPGTLTVPIFS